MDLPDSPPKATLHIIFATAISVITDNPILKLLFQKAAPKAYSEIGTRSVINIFEKFQFPVSHSFSISKNCFTLSLAVTGFGNQNILVSSRKTVPEIPAQLLLYAK